MRADQRGVIHPRLVVGLFIMVLGLLFLLDNLNIADFDDVIRFWPLAPIALGISIIAQPRGTSSRFTGGLLIVAGVWILAYDFGFIPYDFWDAWPLVLIGIGGWLVYRAAFEPELPSTAQGPESTGGPGYDATTTGDSTMSGFGFLCGVNRRSTSKTFQAADATAIMGGCTIDLRDADIAPGTTAVVDAFAFWGGVEVLVPPNWVVINKVLPLLAGAEDRTRQTPEGGKELLVRGTVVMGGVGIANEPGEDE